MLNKYMEILSSHMMVMFYIKFAICFIAVNMVKAKVNELLNEARYKRKKKTFSKWLNGWITVIMWTVLLFVPYVGWFIAFMAIMAGMFGKLEKDKFFNDDRYEKINKED